MLDPLLTDEQKQQKRDAAKEQNKSPEKLSEAPIIEDKSEAMETVSFDDITPDGATLSENTFLTGDTKDTTTDDISFDIGGFDLPEFGSSNTTDSPLEEEAGISFLSGGVPIEATDETTSDASIALVQGATAATSDSIMDNKDIITQDTPMTLIDTSISMIDTPEVSDDIADTPTSIDSDDSSIMGLFADTPDAINEASLIPET